MGGKKTEQQQQKTLHGIESPYSICICVVQFSSYKPERLLQLSITTNIKLGVSVPLIKFQELPSLRWLLYTILDKAEDISVSVFVELH